MQIQPILGYFWAILGLYQPPGPPPPFGSRPPLSTYPGSAPAQVRSLSVANDSQDGGSLLPGMVHSHFIFFFFFFHFYYPVLKFGALKKKKKKKKKDLSQS